MNLMALRAKRIASEYRGRITTLEEREVLDCKYISLRSTNLLHRTGQLHFGAPGVLQLRWGMGLLLLLVVVE